MANHIGKYRIEKTLGEGGMGVVYKAWDTSLDRAVALKTILPQLASSDEVKERLMREARSAARLQHPNVVTVYEFGEIDGQLYIAMEYIRGHSIAQELRQGAPLERKIQIMAQTCQALAYAHEAGIVHRDIKPSNIYISDKGTVKLLDFGIAQIANSELTRTGLTMGTPEYMSPEMVEGGEIDLRSDIFSCGVVFYELLTSIKPFKHDRMATTLYNVLHLEPPPLSKSRPNLPPALEKIVFGMLEKDVKKRFQSLKQVTEEVERLQSQFLMAKAAKAKELNDLYQELKGSILQAPGGEAGRRLVEHEFQDELSEARKNVNRLSNASNPSISLEMVQSELESLEALREKIAGYSSQEQLGQRVRSLEEPTRRLEPGETITQPDLVQEPAEEDTSQASSDAAAVSEQPAQGKERPLQNRWLRPVLAGTGALAVLILLWGVFGVWQGPGDPDEAASAEADRQQLSQQLRTAYEQGLTRQIAELAGRLEALGPLTAQQLFYQGWALVQEGQFQQALKPLEASLQADPGNAYARLLLGRSHWRSSDRNQPALGHLLASLDQGALTTQEEQMARDTILDMEHVFEADHLHGRRFGVFGGGKCSGRLIVSKDTARFKDSEEDKHDILLTFATIATIALDEKRLIIQHTNDEAVFELLKSEEVTWMEKLLGRVHRFEVTASASGTTYRLN